jgi:hypothetical protein
MSITHDHGTSPTPAAGGQRPSLSPPARPRAALDPAMLASIAALSGMDEDESLGFQPGDTQAESSTAGAQVRPAREIPETDFTSLIPGGIRLGAGSGLTREQVAEIVQHLDGVATGVDREGRGDEADEAMDVDIEGEDEAGEEEESEEDVNGTPEPGRPRIKETAAQKRKRNRLTL